MSDKIQFFIKESDFEQALANHLTQHGWEDNILMQPTEEDLVKNWANIIYENNRSINQLGNYPLTASEMQQIMNKVNLCDSPYAVNNFINAKEVCVKRDNEADKNNYGKEVYLKIFDAREICAGQSRYQIVRQPRFKASNPLAGDRRGDVILLINGMPVIHIELKRSRVDVSQACFQIKRYAHEGVFSSGIFSMIQIFVAMTPEETLYFANPGEESRFSSQFYFHWQDFNNTIVRDWRKVATDLLSIPMAHQMVGFYTIADDKDRTLKVLRSYQYFAASRISDVVHQTNWDNHLHRGGYVWHTTGSGKTMTSFKSAQLIAASGDADKVIFLLDRIELGVQSLEEYRGFAGEGDSIQDTADTKILLSKLQSLDKDDRLIVTSLQKMSNIKASANISQDVIDQIGRKRLVFIVDECHRSVFGTGDGGMLISIKHTFPRALLFGFTGTPVFEENAKDEITTETIFGDMLHKYTIANGIPDHNVLGFDIYRENTYQDDELRELVAFHEIEKRIKDDPNYPVKKINSVEEIEDDEELMKIYRKFVEELQMPESYTQNGRQVKGVEGYLPKNIYQTEEHHQSVAGDIVKHYSRLSKNGKFHAILATQNIPEAIAYYRIFKNQYPSLNVVAIFDNNIDNSDGGIVREDALVEMLDDYNSKYGMAFQLSTYAKYKKDVAKRLAHKKPYIGIEKDHSKQVDLLIVVTQMLTGYDSKWVNTLYVDKVMKYVDVIQAFSRTNRLFGPDKPFGIVKYYAFPYTMEQNINDALEVYVDRPLGVFVDKLEANLMNVNRKFLHIRDIFYSHEIYNFERLPDTREDRNMFAKDFSEMTHLLEAAKLQGFVWEKVEYEFQHGDTYTRLRMEIDEQTYLILLQRYRELFERGNNTEHEEWEYSIDTYLTETGTGTIDAEYIDSKFQKFIKNLYSEGPGSELTKSTLQELHKTFATLSQKDQRTAIIILHDIQRGDLHLEMGKTIYDYIAEYQIKELYKQIMILSEATGINASQLINIMSSDVNEQNLNEFNRFENLKLTLDGVKTREFLIKIEGKPMLPFLVAPKIDKILRMFILNVDERERILKAYLNDDMTLETAMVSNALDPVMEDMDNSIETEDPVPDIDKIKYAIRDIISTSLSEVSRYMRPMNEILDSVFYVLGRESLESLDSVGLFISRAFANLYVKKPTIVDKFVSFNLLVTKFEAYLKKLHYLMNGCEIQPQFEREDVMWKDVIHAYSCLWGLKNNQLASYQQLYHYLMMIKEWRNSESHISPTASEQEVDAAIHIIITMYFFTTGSCITDLESAGHDVEDVALDSTEAHRTASTPKAYSIYTKVEAHCNMVAEPVEIGDLPEERRIELLKKCIVELLGYNPKKSVFSKQRHWEAIYRVAADYGFVIDGDYSQFKRFVESMQLNYLPAALTHEFLDKANTGIYAQNYEDWISEGFTGRKLQEFQDIKHCAEVFKNIVEDTIPKKK